MRHFHVQRPGGFVLLEVLVSIMIVAIGIVAIMRGFIFSLESLKKTKMNEQSIYLAKSLMDDLLLEPPAEEDYEGSFGDDIRFGEPFKDWYWEIDVEAEEPDYQERPSGKMLQDLEQIYLAEIRIYHEDVDEERRLYIKLNTILMEPDIFSMQSIQANQLF